MCITTRDIQRKIYFHAESCSIQKSYAKRIEVSVSTHSRRGRPGREVFAVAESSAGLLQTSSSLADVYRTSRVLTTSLTIILSPRIDRQPFYPYPRRRYCIIIGPLEWLIARPYRLSHLSFLFNVFYLGEQFVDAKCFQAAERRRIREHRT